MADLPLATTVLSVLASLPAGRAVGALGDALPDRLWPAGQGWRGRPRPAVTAGTALVAAWSAAALPDVLVPVACLLGWALLLAALVDIRCRLLPDRVVLPLIPLGLAVAAWEAPADGRLAVLGGHGAAAALGYASFAGLAAGYRRLRGRDGLGLGDAKLLAAAGAWVGVEGLSSVVLLAALAALAVAAVLALVRRQALAAGTSVAFGPYLAGALWVVWLHGPLSGAFLDPALIVSAL